MADELNVAAELAKMSGVMAKGFARVDGRLNLISQAQADTKEDQADLKRRVDGLEERRWPIGQLVAMSGAVSAVVATAAFVVGK